MNGWLKKEKILQKHQCKDMQELAQKTAIITGASQGLGLFAREWFLSKHESEFKIFKQHHTENFAGLKAILEEIRNGKTRGVPPQTIKKAYTRLSMYLNIVHKTLLANVRRPRAASSSSSELTEIPFDENSGAWRWEKAYAATMNTSREKPKPMNLVMVWKLPRVVENRP